MLRRTKSLRKKQIVKKGQTAVEYLMLLGFVMAFVLIGFKIYLADRYYQSNAFFTNAAINITGPGPKCGDGFCNNVGAYPLEDYKKCPADC